MTEWIDELAGRLNDDEKRKNLVSARELLVDQLIQISGPVFCSALQSAISKLADELQEKLGSSLKGVAFRKAAGGFVLITGAAFKVTLEGKPKLENHSYELTITRQGSGFVGGDGERRSIPFTIDGTTLFASYQGVKTDDAPELASVILKDLINSELFHRMQLAR